MPESALFVRLGSSRSIPWFATMTIPRSSINSPSLTQPIHSSSSQGLRHPGPASQVLVPLLLAAPGLPEEVVHAQGLAPLPTLPGGHGSPSAPTAGARTLPGGIVAAPGAAAEIIDYYRTSSRQFAGGGHGKSFAGLSADPGRLGFSCVPYLGYSLAQPRRRQRAGARPGPAPGRARHTGCPRRGRARQPVS